MPGSQRFQALPPNLSVPTSALLFYLIWGGIEQWGSALSPHLFVAPEQLHGLCIQRCALQGKASLMKVVSTTYLWGWT